MKLNMSTYCLALLFVISFVGAKPVSDLQSLKELLEEEINTVPYYFSEEMEVEGADGNTGTSENATPRKSNWDSSDPSNSALVAKENILAHLFKDLVRTSKRSWSRYKKGGLRSCFGVRLERIGSLSGLGC